MASSRSKIPVPVSKPTIPKILPSAEPKIGRISTVNRNKKSTTEVKGIQKSNISSKVLKDRNRATTKEKFKPAQVKEKENRICSLEKKIPAVNKDLLKTRVEKKQIKNSKDSAQIPKDRNQPTTKAKSKNVLVKERENPLSLFEKRIPEVNILDDDPFKTTADDTEIKNSKQSSLSLKARNLLKTTKPETAKEKYKPPRVKDTNKAINNIVDDDPFKASSEDAQTKNSNHPSQPNIEFVADDRMKKFILSNRELTPTILKSCSSRARSSVMERLSLYKKVNFSTDPHKQALEELANHRLTSEGWRPSEMKRNGVYASPMRMERPSIYKKLKIPIDPHKQALEDIANYKLGSEGQRHSEMQKNRLCESPAQNRFSCYKRPNIIDPHEEALKSLAELRIQRKIKSCKKKVTFNLCVEEKSDSESKAEKPAAKPVEAIQPEISKPQAFVSEKSLASSELSAPELKEKVVPSLDIDCSNKVTLDLSPKTDHALQIQQINNMEEKETDFSINKTRFPESKETAANNERIFHNSSPTLNQKQGSDKTTDIFNLTIKNSILKTNVNSFLNSLRKSEFRQSLFSNQAKNLLDKANPQIFTPQPVSFYPRTELFESISPEFLSRRTTDILSCAPIQTPLVLKSLGRFELSPVCKKLEFKDSPKETKKESGDSRENSQTFYLQNIMTQQKILDQLTHQECSIFMYESSFPCETRSNLRNPVARILDDGDEMHFVPISLRRLS